MSKRFKVTLTPLNRFYFGGETSFLIEGKEFDNSNSSYIIASACFPQQTSLLGMLRFLILRNNSSDIFVNGKISDKAKAKEWIGERSFAIGTDQGYGKLEKLSSCFLQINTKEGDKSVSSLFYPAPADIAFSIDFIEPQRKTILDTLVGDFLFVNGSKVGKMPVITGYDAKKGMTRRYVGESGVLNEADIFKGDVRIGIRRNNETGKTEENAFYKQIFYRFADHINGEKVEVSFTFEVVLKEENVIPSEAIVELGGDSSKFRLKAELLGEAEDGQEFAMNLPPLYWGNNKCSCFSKVVLLSDAYMERPDCLFDISETKPFRFLKTYVDKTEHYNAFGKSEAFPSKSGKCNLYQNGSVFYFNNKDQQNDFERKIKACPEFARIGYNKYVIKKY